MDERQKASSAGVTMHAGAQGGGNWDALRAKAIGSLWGRSVAEVRIGHGDLWAIRADTVR